MVVTSTKHPFDSDPFLLVNRDDELNRLEEPFHFHSHAQINSPMGSATRRTPGYDYEAGESRLPLNTEHATDQSGVEVNLKYYLPLYQAALRGDWENASGFFERDSDALTARISLFSMTALHVAAASGCWQFVQKLVERMPAESLAMRENQGRTALHYVAIGGSIKAAKAMVRKNPALTRIVNDSGRTPLFYATNWAQSKKGMVKYLSSVTREEKGSPNCPFTGHWAAPLIFNITSAGYYDISLYLIHRYPHLATVRDENNLTLLNVMAENPSSFQSGSRLGFWQQLVYPFVPVEFNYAPSYSTGDMEDHYKNTRGPGEVPTSLQSVTYLTKVPWIKQVHDVKLRHKHALKLVEHICKEVLRMSNSQIIDFFTTSAIMETATRHGTVEIVMRCLQFFPDLIWYAENNRSIFHVAVEHRRENIFNLMNGMTARNVIIASGIVELGNSILHLAAKLAPYPQLSSVSGSAFQMQRELQWFKEVEKLVSQGFKLAGNLDKKTAQEEFMEQHKELLEEGEKWMKDTSNSCMVVSTLIATVVFAAAFTVPGGNNNDSGIPIFLWRDSFMVFVISDALALFSSSSSLLMFLSILTSRFAAEDFLKSLPKRLIIGLASLFFAIATMMVAFCAALAIVLDDRWKWVYMFLACFPVTLFAMLQVPLFIQMVQSTYGRGIFFQRRDRWLM